MENKKTYQLIAFDMDGTLLNSEKKISPRTLEAVNYASDHGKLVALSTGRGLAELVEYLPDIRGVRYLICCSGGYIYDNLEKRCIYNNPLSAHDLELALDASKAEKCMVHLLNDLSIASKEDVNHMDLFHMQVYQPMYRQVVTMVEDMYQYYEQNRPEVNKMNLYHTSPESRERTRKRLESLHLDMEVVDSEVTSLECSNREISKGTGLLHLCQLLSLDVNETIAVGDANNDLSILKAAGLGIAMGNALDSVKEISDVIVADNDHDGCAEAIYDFLMK